MREIVAGVKTPGVAVWRGMREVLPGALVTVGRDGLREHVYWRLTPRHHRDDRQTTIVRLRELLRDTVRRQLVSDVPASVLLSGDLESSAVAGFAAGELAERGKRVRSLSVGFAEGADNIGPDGVYVNPDAPYVRAVVDHLGTDHTDLLLDHASLADPAVREAAVVARDMPVGRGDMDHAFLLQCQAIRESSTVVLSDEGVNETFGDYRWFHDPMVGAAEGFPWLSAVTGRVRQERPYLRSELAQALDIPGFTTQHYRDAVAETPVLDDEDADTRRRRELLYLHLTRSLPGTLDRKDRMSMAVGLQVRVPFCDHRITEYAFNIPWSLHVFGGREKSVLRAASCAVVPPVVLRRVRNPYPAIRGRRYLESLRRQALEVAAEPGHDVFTLVDRCFVRRAAEVEPGQPPRQRWLALEKLLDLRVWLDHYRPRLVLARALRYGASVPHCRTPWSSPAAGGRPTEPQAVELDVRSVHGLRPTVTAAARSTSPRGRQAPPPGSACQR
ncbi:hypothetical protein GCM10012275_16680 [Longimycelium tulufanense]|uniref:asparagine synthase (glutamine-hydrolyzing) n=1 Tax=Longimycelium tulufanense TaxID=907463 RepID=A0A8J3CCK0_9PSEU|nr:asparagine synthase-related protein [Longimycelium tulufanense]GGM46295.1 hypothetical protein GCM10012275_16680 [Longimycelium tulufanense]